MSRLLDQALELAGGDREAWIAALPAADRHLAPMLRELLAEHDRAQTSGFLCAIPGLRDEPAKDDAIAASGELVGPYRLIREIGRGGMGAVWLAERADGSFRRQVACKLPRLAWGAGLAERMAREREIGALLEHPNIARLYDAGVDERGRPYLALEYIAGQSIDAWCQERSLAVRGRLKLIVQVARAVAYAHARLVVHRDLKPSNVLVSADGQTHLLDFGIAKLLHDVAPGEAGLTQEQGRVFTPHFASPEQMRGDAITVQSDVYSLGVLLYELLTGHTPYVLKRKTLAALEEAILEGEPAPASSRAGDKAVARTLRGELDAILAKALRREPAQRYATADALADDIERHLSGERVLAQPDSAWYRLRKAVARHRLGFVAVAVTTLAVLSGAGVALTQARRANLEADRTAAVRDFMFDLVDDAEPDEAHPGAEVTGRQMLAGGVARARRSFAHQPRLRGELLGELARMQSRRGDAKAAAPVIREANELLEREAPPDDPALNRTRVQLAEIALAEDDLTGAHTQARRALDACTQAKADCARARSYANDLLSKIELRGGHPEEALAQSRQSVGNSEAGFGADHFETALALLNLAVVARNAGRLGEAGQALERAQEIAGHQTLRAADRLELSRMQALLDLDLGRFEAARAAFARLAMQSHDPDERALELRLLAQALLALGLPGDAQAQAATAIALGEPARPSPELLFARQAHARSLGLAGAASDGLAEMAAVVAGLESAGYSPTALELLRARRIRAELLARSGELARATAELESVAAAQAAAPSGQPLELAQTLDLLGSVLRSSGLATQALATHERARLLWSEHLPVDHPWALRNALYRAVLAPHAELASTDELPMHYKSRFPATSVWRVTIDRCLGSQARAAPGAADCALFL